MIYFREIKELASKNKVSQEAIEKDYCLNWFLLGLSLTGAAKKGLVFFGGTCLRKIYFENYRLSEDLDFMYKKGVSHKYIFSALDNLYSILQKKVNINYSTDISSVVEEHARLQFFIRYDGFPELVLGAKSFKADFSLELDFIEKPIQRSIINRYSDMAGEKGRLFSYSMEAIAAEKLGAILGRMRHEPRDVYDLWYIINSGQLNKIGMNRCFKRKYGFLPNYKEVDRALSNEIYQKMWQIRLKNQIGDLREYDKVKRQLLKHFK